MAILVSLKEDNLSIMELSQCVCYLCRSSTECVMGIEMCKSPDFLHAVFVHQDSDNLLALNEGLGELSDTERVHAECAVAEHLYNMSQLKSKSHELGKFSGGHTNVSRNRGGAKLTRCT